MIDKLIAEHLQERERGSSQRNEDWADSPNIEKKGRCA